MTDPGVFRVGAERIFRKNAGISLHLRTGVQGRALSAGIGLFVGSGASALLGAPATLRRVRRKRRRAKKKRRGSHDPRRVVRQKKSWQRPTFPPFGSIIGEGVLDFRVRNGNGYFHLSMATSI